MGKTKDTRILISLKCTECNHLERINIQNRRKIIYTTTKNRRNTPDRLELKKFCPYCNSHTIHREIK